ncbi:thiaminase II [Roseovarius aquimarinus]|uniref:Aminopyrimidine aminohydrolase n=1 Tax=Roseovarius aquimarinus TaxID=1229156 RepID=A0ABW7I937_9RHOB
MMYGETFTAWRAGAAGPWHGYTHHPFVQGLGDGSLPREAYLRYMVQDYVFLIHFSRAWALAVTKAETVEEMRFAARTLHALLNEEIALHIATCAAEGLDEETLFAAEELPQNIAYTRYVLDAGHSGDFLDLLAALAPCVLGYGEIGLRLAGAKTGTPYAGWIETYAGEGYQQMCHETGRLLDGAIDRRLGASPQTAPRWQALQHRFETATRLEIDFWGMALPQ